MATSDVEELFIGAKAGGAACEARGQAAPVVAHAAAERAARKLQTARRQLSVITLAETVEAAASAAERVALATRQTARATHIGADAGGRLNDDLREKHPDVADEIGALVIDARFAARAAFNDLDALRTTILLAENGGAGALQRLTRVANRTVRRAEDAVVAARRLDRETYKASPLLLPGSVAD